GPPGLASASASKVEAGAGRDRSAGGGGERGAEPGCWPTHPL
ncbi:MAG: hypothetical protein AVDCRST_MAG59-2002, partial [uncultured Thermomicrobiales bacterium]